MNPKIGRLRSRKGQALAEFAIILPLVFLLIAGIIGLGRAWNIKQAVTDAAREGARITVVQDPIITAGDSALVAARIRARLLLAGITTSTISITPYASRWPIQKSGDPMTVLVATQYRPSWLSVIMGWVGAGTSITISTETTMRNE